MSYSAWSVTFGEQPTAAKWNILGTNDASFNDGSGIGDGVITGVKLNDANGEHIAYSPGTNDDYTTGSMGDWLALGNITAPSWATKARVQVNVTGFYTITSASGFTGRLKIGTATGRENYFINASTSVNVRFNSGWADEITLTATGTLAAVIQANRVSGTGGLRADTDTDVTINVVWIA